MDDDAAEAADARHKAAGSDARDNRGGGKGKNNKRAKTRVELSVALVTIHHFAARGRCSMSSQPRIVPSAQSANTNTTFVST
jgi:hypothetical protein